MTANPGAPGVRPRIARHTIAWNGRDDRDRAVGSGVYFAEVTAGPRRSVSKLFRMK